MWAIVLLSWNDLFFPFAVYAFRRLLLVTILSVLVFEGGILDLAVLVHNHCLSVHSTVIILLFSAK